MNLGSSSHLGGADRLKRLATLICPLAAARLFVPAKQDFGPRMIRVVVAALAAHITPRGWKLELCGRWSEWWGGV